MNRLLLLITFSLILPGISAQENLMNMLNKDTAKATVYTIAAFKTTRVMNGQSIKSMPRGQLDFRISHRFGPVNLGLYEFFGLDQSITRFSLEYGISNWLMVGAGRGTYLKTFDGFAKFTIMRQTTGARVMPVSVLFFTSVAATSVKWSNPDVNNVFNSRLSYVNQFLVGRKFNEILSLQIAPTFVHRNLVPTPADPNDLFSIGAGGRLKLGKRISFNAEYFYLLNSRKDMSRKIYDPLSLGFDIETGGHVFQLIFTNSLGIIERDFIGETTGKWSKGDIHFGFNISRVFTLKK